MKLVKFLLTFLTVFGVLLVFYQENVFAKVSIYNQRSSALEKGSLRFLYNSRVHFIKQPKHSFHDMDPTKKHEIRGNRGKRVTFVTRYLLPDPGKNHEAWGNPQSIAMTHKDYIYIVYCPKTLHNTGRIVRYNIKNLDAMGVRMHPLELFLAYQPNKKGKFSKIQKRIQKQIQKQIKVGPLFDTGHGQSLAYNLKNHGLYMWRDNEKGNGNPINKWGCIVHVNTKILTPDHGIRILLKGHGMQVPGGHDLTFDNSGDAYFWTNPGFGAYVYKGRISSHHAEFELTHQILKKIPGTRVQSMSYNPDKERLLLISDDSIASFPADKLDGHGSLTNSDFEWTGFDPQREFEGVAYGDSSRANLLVNNEPEVLQATTSY